jgi:hypothetical protein
LSYRGRVIALSLVLALSAAEPIPEATTPLPPARPTMETQWYGWQVLGIDAITIASSVGSISIGAPLYVLAPQIAHFANGQIGNMGGSIALRLGLPVLGGAGGYLAFCNTSADGDQRPHCGTGTTAGIVGGMLAATAIDAFGLSYRTVDTFRAVVPSFVATRGHVTAGAQFAF